MRARVEGWKRLQKPEHGALMRLRWFFRIVCRCGMQEGPGMAAEDLDRRRTRSFVLNLAIWFRSLRRIRCLLFIV